MQPLHGARLRLPRTPTSLSSMRSALVLAAALALTACGGGDNTTSDKATASATEAAAGAHDASAATFGHRFRIQKFVIRTLGNRADLVSNGDALVEVEVPDKVPLNRVKVTLNGADISSAFTVADASRRTLRGLVTGLRNGHNLLRVDATTRGSDLIGFLRGFDDDASLVITNHPRGGPVLFASQVQPWICATPTAVPASGDTPASNASGLSTTAVDAQCNIATETKLFYRTTTTPCSAALPDPNPPAVPAANNCFKPYTPGTTPADLATTTTITGLTVPYIVRVERGTLNRGIYDIAVLFDPAQPWTPLAPQPQWNGKVLHSFGASTGHTKLQTRSSQNWSDHQGLARRCMVIESSLTGALHTTIWAWVAETIRMLRAYIADT